MKRIGPWDITAQTFTAWNDDGALQLGAALAYYAAFSISPFLIIVLSAVGFFYKGDGFADIHAQIAATAGTPAADMITAAIDSVHSSPHGVAAAVVSIILLLLGASGVFIQLQSSMNQIWGIKPEPGRRWRDFLKVRLLSLAMIAGAGVLLMVSLVLTSSLATDSAYFASMIPGAGLLGGILSGGVSFGIDMLLFASIFKIVPHARIGWNDVWIGALLTAVLFTVGKLGIGWYLEHNDMGEAFGPAGSVLVALAWVYYSAQILFFGAEFTKVYAGHWGKPVI